MSTIMYTIFKSESEGSGATIIFTDGTVTPVASSNPNFAELVALLTTTKPEDIDEDYVRQLVKPVLTIAASLTRLSERVTFDTASSLLLFDGDPLDGAIAEHIVRILQEGGNTDSYAALVAFLEKLAQNPSESSRKSLYDFIIRYGITIDPDGDFYVYKGVNSDGTSIHSGFGIVNGKTMNSRLPNEPGSVVEIPRSKVDADTSVGCSTGLHAGSYQYASGFSRGKLLTVKVNPRDVVSVPDHCAFQKIRVCRYKVITAETVKINNTTFTFADNTDEDYDNISTVEYLINQDVRVPVEFEYTRGNGDIVDVEGYVTDVFTNRNNEVFLVVAEDETSTDTKFYNFSLVSDLTVDRDIIAEFFEPDDAREDDYYDDYNDYDDYDVSPDADDDRDEDYLDLDVQQDDTAVNVTTPTVTTPAAPAPVGDQKDELLNSFTEGQDVIVDFDYVTLDGEARRLVDFQMTAIRRGNRHTLIVGVRDDDETRSYRADRISNLSIH